MKGFVRRAAAWCAWRWCGARGQRRRHRSRAARASLETQHCGTEELPLLHSSVSIISRKGTLQRTQDGDYQRGTHEKIIGGCREQMSPLKRRDAYTRR
ncbi:unnamed protein product [Knipowitschia caucasica]|uniref:Secreted protein n=1 Tax=Knipowitschia caucasica TaxID=637954 RepID=A0AAV2MSC1_KNICA